MTSNELQEHIQAQLFVWEQRQEALKVKMNKATSRERQELSIQYWQLFGQITAYHRFLLLLTEQDEADGNYKQWQTKNS